jgi:hypothetical protein
VISTEDSLSARPLHCSFSHRRERRAHRAEKITKKIPGDSIPFDAEPALALKIADQAATSSNPASAELFAEASSNQQAAYEKDKVWLEKHTKHAKYSKT